MGLIHSRANVAPVAQRYRNMELSNDKHDKPVESEGSTYGASLNRMKITHLYAALISRTQRDASYLVGTIG